MSKDSYDRFVRAMTDITASESAPPAHKTSIIYYGDAVDVNDPLNTGRIKVFVPEIDVQFENELSRLPWCSYFFTSNVQHIPKVGERVAIIFENPWKKTHGRFWLGPVFNERNVAIPLTSVSLSARPGNAVELSDDGNVYITRDSANDLRQNDTSVSMTPDEVRLIAENIILDYRGVGLGSTEFSLPYGERLVQLLEFILRSMIDHQHPPNNKPVGDWTPRALQYLNDLDSWLLNKNIRHRGQ